MPFLKSVARRSTISGTARWSAAMYHEFVTHEPDSSLVDIAYMTVMARYGREATAAPRGNAAKTMGFLAASIEDDGIDSLTHLVVLILVAEAGLLELDTEAQGTIVDAVREELLKKGVPARFALGSVGVRARTACELLHDFTPVMVKTKALIDKSASRDIAIGGTGARDDHQRPLYLERVQKAPRRYDT